MLSYSDPLPEPPRQSQMDLTAPGQVSSWTSPPWRDRGTGWLAQRQTMLSHSWGELLIMWRVISVSSQISGIVLCNYLSSKPSFLDHQLSVKKIFCSFNLFSGTTLMQYTVPTLLSIVTKSLALLPILNILSLNLSFIIIYIIVVILRKTIIHAMTLHQCHYFMKLILVIVWLIFPVQWSVLYHIQIKYLNLIWRESPKDTV